MKLNLPNRLTLLRIILVPLYMVFLLYPIGSESVARWIALILFALTALTDLFDGKIARGRGLVTDFGKFLDPLADKFMIFGALVAICASDMFAYLRHVFVWVAAVIIFRELAVTSLRLLISGSDHIVLAASMAGKIKTTAQCVGTCVIIIEPVLVGYFYRGEYFCFLSFAAMAVMVFFTLWSGVEYFVKCAKYLDPEK